MKTAQIRKERLATFKNINLISILTINFTSLHVYKRHVKPLVRNSEPNSAQEVSFEYHEYYC